MSSDRPTPRARIKATPAVDEAAGATPISPAVAPTPDRTPPAPPITRTGAFAQLNVRITLDVQDGYIMAHEILNKVNAVSDAIAARLRTISPSFCRPNPTRTAAIATAM